MKLNWKPSMIRKPPTPPCATTWPTPSNCFPCTNAPRFCFAAKMVYRMMRQRAFWRFHLAL